MLGLACDNYLLLNRYLEISSLKCDSNVGYWGVSPHFRRVYGAGSSQCRHQFEETLLLDNLNPFVPIDMQLNKQIWFFFCKKPKRILGHPGIADVRLEVLPFSRLTSRDSFHFPPLFPFR
jgi:hypothetical protein